MKINDDPVNPYNYLNFELYRTPKIPANSNHASLQLLHTSFNVPAIRLFVENLNPSFIPFVQYLHSNSSSIATGFYTLGVGLALSDTHLISFSNFLLSAGQTYVMIVTGDENHRGIELFELL